MRERRRCLDPHEVPGTLDHLDPGAGSARRRPWRRPAASGSARRTEPTGTRIPGSPASSAGALPERPHHFAERCSQDAARASAARSGSAKYAGQGRAVPSSASSSSASPRRGELVDLARPRAQRLASGGRSPCQLRPAAVADRAERVDGQHAEEPLGHRLGDVEGEVPAPRMADDVRSPSRARRGRSVHPRHPPPPCRAVSPPTAPAPLLVPRDVVPLRELVCEVAQVVEAEPWPSGRGEPAAHRRRGDPAISGPRRRGEGGPRHRRHRRTPLPVWRGRGLGARYHQARNQR